MNGQYPKGGGGGRFGPGHPPLRVPPAHRAHCIIEVSRVLRHAVEHSPQDFFNMVQCGDSRRKCASGRVVLCCVPVAPLPPLPIRKPVEKPSEKRHAAQSETIEQKVNEASSCAYSQAPGHEMRTDIQHQQTTRRSDVCPQVRSAGEQTQTR